MDLVYLLTSGYSRDGSGLEGFKRKISEKIMTGTLAYMSPEEAERVKREIVKYFIVLLQMQRNKSIHESILFNTRF